MRKDRRPHGREARWRDEERRTPSDAWFIAGINGVIECLRSPAVRVRKLWIGRHRLPAELETEIQRAGISPQRAEEEETSHGRLIQGVAALVAPPNEPDLDELLARLVEAGERPLLVALDQVEDPMNLGQILRTCDGAGVHAVLLPRHRSAHMTQTVAQVSQGAFAWVPVCEVANLRNSLDQLKKAGLWIIGCEGGPGSSAWHACDLADAAVLVLGAEGRGLRELTRKSCETLAYLPMKGRLASLNVGAAAAAFLYEAVRQRTPRQT